MAPKKRKPKKSAKAGVAGVNEFLAGVKRCPNDEQSEAALVYAVKSFNKYFSEGIIVAKVENERYKIVTFGEGKVREHFHPVLWKGIRAAFEAFKEGPDGASIFES